MGDFLLKSSISKDFKADTVSIGFTLVGIVDIDSIIDTAEARVKTKKIADDAILKVKNYLSDCKTDISMMSLKAVGKENTFTNTTDNKKSLFAKSNKKYCADCSAYIKVIVEIDDSNRDKCEENLVDLFGFLYNPDLPDAFVIGTFISYDSYIRDYKAYSDTLIDDLTKKCREDANRVVEGLGFKISGVSKISFNNTAVSNAKVKYSEDYTSQRSFTSKGYMGDDECSFDGLDESFSDDNAFGNTDVVKADANTVSSLVNKQYTLSLDIDVVFKVD